VEVRGSDASDLAEPAATTAFFAMRPTIALLLGVLALSACSGEPTLPGAIAGHYELASVNGQPLPYVAPPSIGYATAPILAGDLMLRGDGTYALGAQAFVEGGWSASGNRLTLGRLSGAGGPATALAGGDSVVIDIPGSPSTGVALGGSPTMHFVFRRPTRGAPVVTAGTFILTSINGRGEPLTSYDTIAYGMHQVRRVLYDSVLFTDGAFFRRHRTETFILDDDVGINEFITFGSYRGHADSLVLMSYYPFTGQVETTDRVAYEQGQLVRRRAFLSGPYVERFTRR
jgi:hypothetical protein